MFASSEETAQDLARHLLSKRDCGPNSGSRKTAYVQRIAEVSNQVERALFTFGLCRVEGLEADTGASR